MTSENSNLPTISDDLLLQCMHCGMCLPTCPTYVLTKRERSSPRGRIRLIKSVSDGKLAFSQEFIEEMNFCLDCRACETACPAGVHYSRIIDETRRVIIEKSQASLKARIIRKIMLNSLFARQNRLQTVAKLIRIYQKSGLELLNLKFNIAGIFSRKLKMLSPLAPQISSKFTYQLLPEFLPAHGESKYKVGFLTGCIQDVAFADVNYATAQVLVRNNCDVYVPRNQVCCGSVHAHSGAVEQAQQQLVQNTAAFNIDNLDFVIVNAAGCGSFLKECTDVEMKGNGEYPKIKKLASKTRDISEFLNEINFRKPKSSLNLKVTYHDACHLVHGQKIRNSPRSIITAIPGIKFIEMPESDWCCGSAGVYNITHTATSFALLDRKFDNIETADAEIIVSANTGCSIQLAYGVRQRKSALKIMHPVELLWWAYQKENIA
ncbi:MAG: (Fe-S)-binding protein [Calditrichaeota bacterium]|nr:MAG: (Fe-S)-binding protein [Calditrichota bacterium]